MRSYSFLAAAKINLYLEIIGDRPDGFHELAMVMQSVSLADRIDIQSLGEKAIQVHCNHPEVPTDETNLAHRAAALLAEEFPEAYSKQGGVDITIDKRIPVGAGLAGGSTNAAAVLVGVDMLWELGLTQLELQDLGAKLGSDVPFCVIGGTAIATGRGEKLDPLPDLDNLFVVLGKYTSLAVSTPWAYKTYRQQFNQTYVSDTDGLEARQEKLHAGPMVNAIIHRDGPAIAQALYNDFEKVVFPAHPPVQALRDAMQSASSLGAMMSGSGPTVFALAASKDEAENIKAQVKTQIPNPDLNLWVAQFNTTGIQLLG